MSAAALALLTAPLYAGAVVNLTLSNQGQLPANDDDSSTSAVDLAIGGGSGINFFGQNFTQVWVNNNGNVTFGDYLSQYEPNALMTGVNCNNIGTCPIIAPFFADVDTTGTGSGLTTYGNATYNGHEAFVVDWPNVGYYESHADKLNTFQLILTDRSDTGAGNFDIEFNYDQILWETGDITGSNGFGGSSAVAGYSNGMSGSNNVYYQLPGSLMNGTLIDGGADSLTGHSLGSNVLGRYDFQVRNGNVIVPPVSSVPEPFSAGLIGVGLIGLAIARKRIKFSHN